MAAGPARRDEVLRAGEHRGAEHGVKGAVGEQEQAVLGHSAVEGEEGLVKGLAVAELGEGEEGARETARASAPIERQGEAWLAR